MPGVLHIAEQHAIQRSGARGGHAALLIEEGGVHAVGDMLSDVLIPMLDLNDNVDPIEDYLAALRLLEGAADDVVIPGHGPIGRADQVRARIEKARAYADTLHDVGVPDDPGVGPSATFDWLPSVHQRQLEQLARRRAHDKTPR
jgi:glyoxylase-like metal-dependent hydrolase (beta-lactamase superfamily II)